MGEVGSPLHFGSRLAGCGVWIDPQSDQHTRDRDPDQFQDLGAVPPREAPWREVRGFWGRRSVPGRLTERRTGLGSCVVRGTTHSASSPPDAVLTETIRCGRNRQGGLVRNEEIWVPLALGDEVKRLHYPPSSEAAEEAPTHICRRQ